MNLTPGSADTPPAPPIDTSVHQACGEVTAGLARCFAEVRVPQPRAALAADALPEGYGPADLASAYHLTGTPKNRPTVAIVDAFDDPNAESDLAVYRETFGLPPCTTASGCFRKINQRGGTMPPRADVGWAEEISLDIQMVSAVCPTCKILLVEGDDNSHEALAAAERTAASSGAVVISNSFGGQESPLMKSFEGSYRHQGVTIVASTGDHGFRPAQQPAVFKDVIAVGGTTLTRDPSTPRGWSESAWSGAGSGCSAFIRKPSWQHDKHCSMRTIADVSAVADPDPGVAVYDTFGESGWLSFGGTSVSAPIIGAVIARSGDGGKLRNASSLYDKRNRRYLNDPVGGSNVSEVQDCGGDYLCTGLPGYDGPTGVGTPWTTGAF
jgi:subtilase family serine protease